jgi:hypothetical protein
MREEGFDERTIADALGQKTDSMARHRAADLSRWTWRRANGGQKLSNLPEKCQTLNNRGTTFAACLLIKSTGQGGAQGQNRTADTRIFRRVPEVGVRRERDDPRAIISMIAASGLIVTMACGMPWGFSVQIARQGPPTITGETEMSLIEDVFKGGNIVSGLAVGIGIAIVAPVVLPVLRPLAKSVIKAGLVAYDQGRVAFAEMAERTEDILAEARAEMDEEAKESESEQAKSLT